MFKIDDERTLLFQWDLNRFLIVDESLIKDGCTRVDYSFTENGDALTCEIKQLDDKHIVEIPNVMLQKHGLIYVWADILGEDKLVTRYKGVFRVYPKAKPADYVYTETETLTVKHFVEQALIEAKKSGLFDGPPGPKGDPGVLEFIPVDVLPTENIKNAIYLIPIEPTVVVDEEEETEEIQNNFLEYIYVNGEWECIGIVGFSGNLSDYVKKTDVATKGDIKTKKDNTRFLTSKHIDLLVKQGLVNCSLSNEDAWTDEEKALARTLLGAIGLSDYATAIKHGIVKVNEAHGLVTNSSGNLLVKTPSNEEIDAKEHRFKPITPSIIDYAVMKALTDSKNHEWTAEEQANARTQIGAIGSEDYATKDNGGVVKVNNDLAYGTYISSQGVLMLKPASKVNIDGRNPQATERAPITTSNIDYSVMKALSDSKHEWTEEEKASALELLGGLPIVNEGDSASTLVYCVLGDGTQSTTKASTSPVNGHIALRGANGVLNVGTPTNNAHATTKKYVDDLFGAYINDIASIVGGDA